ncbi:MAG: hypothetical protein ACRDTG_28575 [Pseudonocardiaceae bacterium]
MASRESLLVEDFDAWRATRAAKTRPKIRIYGEIVDIPLDISVDLAQRIEDADDSDNETIWELTEELYGPNTLEKWIEQKIGTQELAVLLAWSVARSQGAEITLDQAERRQQEITSAKAKGNIDEGKAGKAGNRANRRARTRSENSGDSSSRTSSGSTRSSRRISGH